MADFQLAYVTCTDEAEAKNIATQLVNNQLAACVNIISNVCSIYAWQGQLQDDNEVLLLAKTAKTAQLEVSALIKMHHSYDTPCICYYALDAAEPDYLAWLTKNLGNER